MSKRHALPWAETKKSRPRESRTPRELAKDAGREMAEAIAAFSKACGRLPFNPRWPFPRDCQAIISPGPLGQTISQCDQPSGYGRGGRYCQKHAEEID